MEHNFTPLPQSVQSFQVPENRLQDTGRIRVIVGALVLLVILGIIIFFPRPGAHDNHEEVNIVKQQEEAQPSVAPTPSLIPYPTGGMMRITTQDGKTAYPAGSTVTIVIQATSEEKNIAAFDAVVSYNSIGFSFLKASTPLGDFSLSSFNRTTHISLSGVQTLQAKESTTWNNTKIASLEFAASAPGSYSFSLDSVGKETSKLIDETGNPSYPATTKLQLEIQ